MKTKTNDRMGFLTVEQLGPKQSMTPEGFLLCESVPIARIGNQMYSDKEIPLEGDADGLLQIERAPDEVFKDETLASFEGKPVTIDHPDTFVNPENWKELAVGVTQNVRRGAGIEDDLLLADLLVTDQQAIEAVRAGLREVSCGYEADYEQVAPGKGRQLNIVGNHVALVERGRAGPRCSIQDKDLEMKQKPKGKLSFIDKLKKFLDTEVEAEKLEKETADEDEMENQEPAGKGELEAEEKPTYDEGDINERLARIEAVLAKLVPMEEEEHETSLDAENEEAEAEEEETTDDVLEAETAETNGEAKGQVLTGDSLKAVIARAEILAPGIQMPTGDAAKTGKAIATLQRKALATAYATADGKKAIDPFLMKRNIKQLTGDALNSVFTGAAELMRATNNARGTRNTAAKTTDFGKATSPTDINARNREFWAKQTGR
jgi:hypothetical protein